MTQTTNPEPVVIAVRKRLAEKEFVNVYYFHCPAAGGPLARVDLGMATLAPMVVDFERRQYVDDVFFLDAYVGDAVEQPPRAIGANASYFDRYTVNQPGLATLAGEGYPSGAALNIALHVRLLTNRERPGHKYYRGMIGWGGLAPGGRSGVKFINTSTIGVYQTQFNTAASGSLLANYFEGGSAAGTAILALPHYQKVGADNQRDCVAMTFVRGLQVADVTARKLDRTWYNRRAADQV